MRPLQVSYGDAGSRLKGKLDAYRSENMELFEHGTGFMKWMIDPDANLPQRVPDDLSSASAVFKTRTIFTLPYCAPWNASDSISDVNFPTQNPPVNGISTMIACPGTTNAMFHTLQELVTFIADDAKEGDHSAYPILISSDLDANGYLTHGLARDDLAIIPRQNADGIPIFESYIFDSPPGNINLTISFERVNGAGAIIDARAIMGYRLGVPGVTGPFVETDIPWDGSIGAVNFTLPGAINAFYIQVSDSDPGSKWTFSMGTQDPVVYGIEWQLPGFSSTAYRILSPRDLRDLTTTYQERNTSLSLLASYVGTDFANGGLACGARLPMGMTLSGAPNGDYFSYLASLPIYSADNPLKKGSYVWWCPDSTTEFFYVPYKTPRSALMENTSMIVQTFTRDDPNQDIRISVVCGVEVLTRSNLYATFVGPVNPMFPKILEFGKLIPAATENPIHSQFLSGIFNKVKKTILSPANWLKFGKGLLGAFTAA
jgi:hypothetical protein